MGQPKATLRFGPATIIERLIAELDPAFDELIVIAAPSAVETFAIEGLLRDWLPRIRLLRDLDAFAGPVQALIRGLRAARHPIAFVCSCDLPLIRAEVARALCAMIDQFDGVVPEIDGRSQSLCAAYHKAALDKVERLADGGVSRLGAIVERLDCRCVTEVELRRIDPDLRSFLNVNTPADYAHALATAGLKP
jgi:molybdopterin-guanine dinucleotide biosynthesis protein A